MTIEMDCTYLKVEIPGEPPTMRHDIFTYEKEADNELGLVGTGYGTRGRIALHTLDGNIVTLTANNLSTHGEFLAGLPLKRDGETEETRYTLKKDGKPLTRASTNLYPGQVVEVTTDTGEKATIVWKAKETKTADKQAAAD